MKLDDIKKLQQKKYRAEFGHFLVEGEHLVLELQNAVQHRPILLGSRLYVTEAYAQWASPFPVQVVSDKQMAQISDTKTPQGIVAVVPIFAAPHEHTEREKNIYLHEVQDPGNLGTILRTLAWFGGFRLLLSPNSVDPYNPKVVRSSMGAIFHVPMELDVPLDALSQRFSSIACLDMHGQALTNPSFATHDCYLFGNEARGVPQTALTELRANAYSIKGSGLIESLNLATAVNLAVYELNR
ncbi:TrmH family RNA methyltransferase [Salinispirillum marinum]|uniref:TrmH family RNA methyltransferase n=2 Tax=Saccharospirillaceae TaxID=255527 RepID=A0ABV8BJ36_9GAMM